MQGNGYAQRELVELGGHGVVRYVGRTSHEWVTYQTFMNRRSLAGIEWRHVHEDKVFGKFPEGGLSALEIVVKNNTILQQRTE